MSRGEITRQFDAIVDFAGVERFLDTPVKRYSSGMYVRLAFAVAAHLETEILIVDEVLAVGDAQFQQKCLGRMHDVAQAGRTVVLVSHQMQSIEQLCHRVVLLDGGTVAYQGDSAEAIQLYLQAGPASGGERRVGASLPEVHVAACTSRSASYAPGDPKRLRLRVEAGPDLVPGTWVSVHLVDAMGVVVAQCDSRLAGFTLTGPGTHHLDLDVRTPWLREGRYSVDTFICSSGVVDRWEGACTFDVLPQLPYDHAAPPDAYSGAAVLTDFSYQVQGP